MGYGEEQMIQPRDSKDNHFCGRFWFLCFAFTSPSILEKPETASCVWKKTSFFWERNKEDVGELRESDLKGYIYMIIIYTYIFIFTYIYIYIIFLCIILINDYYFISCCIICDLSFYIAYIATQHEPISNSLLEYACNVRVLWTNITCRVVGLKF